MEEARRIFSMLVIISLFVVDFAIAGEFTPSSYEVGDTLGQYLIIRETESGTKYVTGIGKDRLGRLEFNSLNLSSEFELTINADFETSYTQKILLKAGDSELDQLVLSFSGYSIYFGDNSGSSNWESGDYINNLRLHVKDGTAKLYINDELLGKKELDNPDTAYTKLIINGIKKDDRLFEVTVPDHTFSLAPVISEFDFDPDSGYQKNDTLGEYLVVKEDSYAEKYVAGTGADRLGRLEFCSLNLSGAFEVIMNADLQTSYA